MTESLAERLERMGACGEGRDWAASYGTAAEAWADCPRPDYMLWALDAAGLTDAAKSRLFGCWCARHTPVADGRTTWDLLTDSRSRAAVEVAERFARGQAAAEELAAAARSAAAAWSAAAKAQADALRKIFGSPFAPVEAPP